MFFASSRAACCGGCPRNLHCGSDVPIEWLMLSALEWDAPELERDVRCVYHAYLVPYEWHGDAAVNGAGAGASHQRTPAAL